ncbi:MAG: hypothetical protein BMS9Abin20_0979 [Acidimicrobiia bacterium]|nr:MAG: hypothetical protein BMS9Abin20_0979 [Acidimicrobiia bacterium]
MPLFGDSVSAAIFETREQAEDVWEFLAEAGIPATVVTDPGLLGPYSVTIEVDREDLERAVDVIKRAGSTEDPSSP